MIGFPKDLYNGMLKKGGIVSPYYRGHLDIIFVI